MFIFFSQIKSLFFLFFLFFSLYGCSGKDGIADQKRSQEVQRSLCEVISSIHSLKDAQLSSKKMESLFLDLADIMIHIDISQREKSSLNSNKISKISSLESQLLEEELRRIVSIPGVEEVVKRSQEKGRYKLERYIKGRNRYD